MCKCFIWEFTDLHVVRKMEYTINEYTQLQQEDVNLLPDPKVH